MIHHRLQIDGRVLYPATGYLVLAWRALAKLSSQTYHQMAVTFEDVQIHHATIIPKTGTVTLQVSINPGSGSFEVTENEALVVSGRILRPPQEALEEGGSVLEVPVDLERQSTDVEGAIRLSAGDVYKQLRLRGYDYGPTFQGIMEASNNG